MIPNYSQQLNKICSDSSKIAGVDEVGRGSLAGPVFAAAVVLNPDKPIAGLMDSKKLTAKRREQLAQQIEQCALYYALGQATVAEIDQLNILQASLVAMWRAVQALGMRPKCVLVDGQHAPPLPCQVITLIKGDQQEAAISAASILAKVARDHEMQIWDQHYPAYHFASNKGYPSQAHLHALTSRGISAIHRRSFGPVQERVRSAHPT